MQFESPYLRTQAQKWSFKSTCLSATECTQSRKPSHYSDWFEYLQEILGKSFFENNPNNFSADITNAHNIINNNIETIANMNQFYDSKKQQEKSQHNDSYQRYYTNIYTPETIGQYVYKPVAVPVNVNMGQIKSAIWFDLIWFLKKTINI